MSASLHLKRTPLFDVLVAAGGRMVDFHGWEMPVQFSGILAEHQAVRSECGVFDVSHMGQIFLSGPDAARFLDRVQCNRISTESGRGTYSHLLSEEGGILDDTITYCLSADRFLMVVNAATLEADFAWLERESTGFDVVLDNASDRYGLLAVQGPGAPALVEQLFPGALERPRFGVMESALNGASAVVMRTGYTGEDGFEIAISTAAIQGLWEDLFRHGASCGLLPCGLGCRDTLRLEAGYLLYGVDADETRTPYEASCGWVFKAKKGNFIGRDAVLRRKEAGFQERLTGVRLLGRGVPRAGCPVWLSDEKLGELTSATFSPSLKEGIGLGYLSQAAWVPGTRVDVEVHGKRIPAEIVRTPFRPNSV